MQREERHPRPFWLNTRTRLSRSSGDRSRVSSTGLGSVCATVLRSHHTTNRIMLLAVGCWPLAYGVTRYKLNTKNFVRFVRAFTRLHSTFPTSKSMNEPCGTIFSRITHRVCTLQYRINGVCSSCFGGALTVCCCQFIWHDVTIRTHDVAYGIHRCDTTIATFGATFLYSLFYFQAESPVLSA